MPEPQSLVEYDTPASRMLPNPHIMSVEDGISYTETPQHIAAMNDEIHRYMDGADPRTLSNMYAGVRMAKEAQKATTDKVSGLLNRDGIELWFERHKPETFLVISSDGKGFGQINKKFGHDAGDRVIQYIGKEASNRLRTDFGSEYTDEERRQGRQNSDAVASVTSRWGGDEFISVVNLTGLNDEEIEVARQSIMGRFDNFGTYSDPDAGDIPIEVRSVSMIGHASDDKDFGFYQRQLDGELQKITQDEKTSAKAESEIVVFGEISDDINPNNFGAKFFAWVDADESNLNYTVMDEDLKGAFKDLAVIKPGIYERLEFLSHRLSEVQADMYGEDPEKKEAASRTGAEIRKEISRLSKFGVKALVDNGHDQLALVK